MPTTKRMNPVARSVMFYALHHLDDGSRWFYPVVALSCVLAGSWREARAFWKCRSRRRDAHK